jgi:glycerol kinase
MRRAILAIDQGTTNTKALLVSEEGHVLADASQPTGVTYPQPGWAELSPAAIWESVTATIGKIVAQTGDVEIAGIGITNQRESALLWERGTGRPIGPCVLWQCRRTSDICAALRATGRGAMVQERTGLTLDPLFSATKFAWLLDNIPGARAKAEQGNVLGGTVDSWLLWNLTGGVHATDYSNAARTQLLSIDNGTWDIELAKLFGVPLSILPDVRSSDARFGETAKGVTALPPGIPILAMMGDSHAALFGHGIEMPGRVKVTCGTGSSLMTPTIERPRSAHGLSSTIAWKRKGELLYALEGNITVSGEVLAFATRLLGLAHEGTLVDLAATVDDSEGVVFVPSLAGLGAPYWSDRAKGVISGMHLGTRPAHVARAAVEAVALQIRDVLAAAEADLGYAVESLSVDGGASRNDLLMQLLADVVDRPVIRLERPEMSALGVARMAAENCGFRSGSDGYGATTGFQPQMTNGARSVLLDRWSAAINNVRQSAH